MTEKKDYIEYKLKKADESLSAAQILLENHFWADTLSKIYYAAFHALNALLIKKGLNPKSHSGVKSLFHREFIYTGVIEKEYADLYDTLLAKRFEADYESFALIDEKKVPEYLESVKKFIEIIREQIQLDK